MRCDRLEQDCLLADLGGPLDAHIEQCEDCRERLRGYQHIARVIAEGNSAREAPPGWRRRTMARIFPVPAWRHPRVVVGAAMAAAALVLLVVLVPDRNLTRTADHNPELAMQIVEDGEWRASDEPAASAATEQRRFVAHPGELVRARALPADAPYFEIRVYRGARDLLLSCPGAGPPACRDPHGALFLAPGAARTKPEQSPFRGPGAGSLLIWKIPSVGTYQVVFLVSQHPIADARGTFDDDIAAATKAGAQAVDVETIRVH